MKQDSQNNRHSSGFELNDFKVSDGFDSILDQEKRMNDMAYTSDPQDTLQDICLRTIERSKENMIKDELAYPSYKNKPVQSQEIKMQHH